MKVKTYEQCTLVHRLCAFLEQFAWFREMDIQLCHASAIAFRWWWQELWVRSVPNHPSACPDREIEEWYKKNFVLAWDLTQPTPHLINLIRRWREYEKRFPPRLDDESLYPIKFDHRFSGFTTLPQF
ncbi:MAG: hypothetical protein V4524_02985 [Patescibacteria group bacterium]